MFALCSIVQITFLVGSHKYSMTIETQDCNSGGCTYDVIPDGDCLLLSGTGEAPPIEEFASGGFLLDGTAIDQYTFNETASSGFLLDGTGSDTQQFNYVEVATGGFLFDGAAIDSQLFNYVEVASGGFVLSQAPYSNGFTCRVLVTVPAGTVTQNIDKFYLGIKADLPPAVNSVAITTFAGVSLQHELRKVDTGTVWVFFNTPLLASTDNKFYLYYGR